MAKNNEKKALKTTDSTDAKKVVKNDAVTESKSEKNSFALKITAISLAAVTVILLVAGLIIALTTNNTRLNYMEDNLSAYITLSVDDYKNFPAEINVAKPTELEVNDKIIKLLCANRVEPEGDAPYKKNIPVAAGDAVSIYYRGYTLTAEGKKDYFDGGCNFSSATPSSLEIGSGSFIPGFELNLVGKNQKDYATFEKVDEGYVKADDIILITYSVFRGDGSKEESKSATIDLSDAEAVDAKWGAGFAEYWTNAEAKHEIGKKIEDTITVGSIKDAAKEDAYTNVTVTEVYRIHDDDKPVLEVEAFFPLSYSKEELQGKTAYFETFILAVKDYEAPEFDEKFITETLKVTADDLVSYEGEGIVEKYKSLLKEEAEEDYKDQVLDAVATVFWKHILEVAKFKKLPKGDVQSYFNSLHSQIETAYPNYQSSYSTLDAFARAYLGLDSKADWEAELRKDAEQSVKQKIAFYYIIRQENFIPGDAEYQALKKELYDREIESYLEYYGIKETDKDYADKLQSAKDLIDSTYADSYWDTQVIFEYGVEKICALAKVTNKADK